MEDTGGSDSDTICCDTERSINLGKLDEKFEGTETEWMTVPSDKYSDQHQLFSNVHLHRWHQHEDSAQPLQKHSCRRLPRLSIAVVESIEITSPAAY